MTNMGKKLTEEEANEMIACADCDAQGEIDYKGVTHVFCEICISGDDVVYPHSYVLMIPVSRVEYFLETFKSSRTFVSSH